MRKTKKVLSVILACITIFGTSVTAFAADESTNSNENIEVVNLSQNIYASEIEEIKDSVVSNIICEDGTEIPMTTVVTIEDSSVSSNARSYSSNNNSYKVTITATADTTQDTTSAGNNSRKIDSDSADKNSEGVVASITLQLMWTDLKGTDNRFDEVSGKLTVKKGTLQKATLRYGSGFVSSALWKKIDVTKLKSFSYKPGITIDDPTASYSASFKDAIVTLYVRVSASVFQ